MKNTILYYNSPSEIWTDALPLGNGRMGAMVYGNILKEEIQCNEETFWSGYPDPDADNPECALHLQEMQELLFEGKTTEAGELARRYLVCKGRGSGGGHAYKYPYGSFETAGSLFLEFDHSENVENYERTLDISKGIATVKYDCDGVSYIRTVFASYKANTIVVNIHATKAFNCSLSYERNDSLKSVSEDGINLNGVFSEGRGQKYSIAVSVNTDGAKTIKDGKISIADADDVTVYIAAATEYLNETDPITDVSKRIEYAKETGYTTLKELSEKHFYSLLSKSSVNIGASDYKGPYTISERLHLLAEEKFDEADIKSLLELYWQFGRYLMISSSYDSKLPANLQGIWSEAYDTIWSADYHININIQMNYWHTDMTQLSECNEAFLRYIRFLSEEGKTTAKTQYNARGWVAHTITNPWGFTAPGEGVSWGSFMCAGAWCCEHIWDHYLFTLDKDFLSENYPILRGACKFFLDFLKEDPRTGYLVTAPSNSPENTFIDPITGKRNAICAGPTMDNSIVYELFRNTAEAAEILDIDKDFAKLITDTAKRLPPIKVGKHGQIMEWQEDYEEAEPGHRHLSMLYGLHPSNLITKSKTPELYKAAENSIERRLSAGGGHTGWSRAWIINFYARLHNGNACEEHLKALLYKSTYNNLFDKHPPFQIDGNFGAVSGVAEMLLQSHDGFVELLPALPDSWTEGSFTGICARGGFSFDAEWKDSKLVSFTVLSSVSDVCEVRYDDEELRIEVIPGVPKKVVL